LGRDASTPGSASRFLGIFKHLSMQNFPTLISAICMHNGKYGQQPDEASGLSRFPDVRLYIWQAIYYIHNKYTSSVVHCGKRS